MNYDEWILTIPKELTGDSLWKMEAYRFTHHREKEEL